MGWFRTSPSIDVPEPVAAGTGERLRFDELKAGQTATVVEVASDSPNSVRLQEMGLSVGAVFKVIEIAPFGDPIQICLRGYRLCLRKREAREFIVELIQKECPCVHPR